MTQNYPSRYPGKLDEILAERHGFSQLESDNLSIPLFRQAFINTQNDSLLDPHETTSPNPVKPTYREQFLEPCREEYDATVEAYEQIYSHPSDGQRYELQHCREHAYFAMDSVSGDVKVMTDACRQRWCPMCAAQKASFARESTQAWLESLAAPRFLTLTLRHCEDDLKPQIEYLQDCFRRLRQRAYWKKRVTGGVWFLQVHRSESDGCWHPHFHILLEGEYLEQGELSDLWDLVSYGSPIIDIRRIHNPESSAMYVARYSARPARFASMPLDDRVEMIEALKGKRLCGTFGTAKVITLTPPKIESSADWKTIGYYDTLVKDAKTNKDAYLILQAWIHEHPITDEQFEAYTGHEVNPYIPVIERNGPVQYLLDFYNTS